MVVPSTSIDICRMVVYEQSDVDAAGPARKHPDAVDDSRGDRVDDADLDVDRPFLQRVEDEVVDDGQVGGRFAGMLGGIALVAGDLAQGLRPLGADRGARGSPVLAEELLDEAIGQVGGGYQMVCVSEGVSNPEGV